MRCFLQLNDSLNDPVAVRPGFTRILCVYVGKENITIWSLCRVWGLGCYGVCVKDTEIRDPYLSSRASSLSLLASHLTRWITGGALPEYKVKLTHYHISAETNPELERPLSYLSLYLIFIFIFNFIAKFIFHIPPSRSLK